MPSFNASMIRYDAAAGHVVLVERHQYSFSAAFNDSGLLLLLHCTGVVRGGVGQNKHFLYVQVPGVDIVTDYYYWMVQHPAVSIHAPKSAGNTFMHAACVFFSVQKVQEIRSCLSLIHI